MTTYNIEEIDVLPSLSDSTSPLVEFSDLLAIPSDGYSLPEVYQDILPAISETLTRIPVYQDTLPALYDARVLPPIDIQSILGSIPANANLIRPINARSVLSFSSALKLNLIGNFVSHLSLIDYANYLLRSVPIDVATRFSIPYSLAYLDYNLESNQFALHSFATSHVTFDLLTPAFNFISIVQRFVPTEILQSDFLNSDYREFYTTAILTYPLYANSHISDYHTDLKVAEVLNIKSLLNLSTSATPSLISNTISIPVLYTSIQPTLHATQSLQSMLNLLSQSNALLIADFTDILHVLDNLKPFFLKDAISSLHLHSQIVPFAGSFLVSYLDLKDNIQTNLLLAIKDILKLTSKLEGGMNTQADIVSVLFLWDFIKEVYKNYGIYIYFNFYSPEKFTFLQIDHLKDGDILFLQEDGIYTIDTEDYEDDNTIILDLSQLQLKNVKRIDKIYYSHQPDEIIVIADNEEYFLEPKETFSQAPKGLRAKDYKIILSGLEELEYLTLFVYPEFRSKL